MRTRFKSVIGLVLMSVLYLSLSRAEGGIISNLVLKRHKTYVLAVGLDYKSSRGLSLKWAEFEAQKIFQTLTASPSSLANSTTSLILLGSKATRSAILSELSRLRNKLEPDDTLIMYWSGHSTYSVKDQEVFLIPDDHDFANESFDTSLALRRDVLPAGSRPDIDFVFIGDGCHIGTGLFDSVEKGYPRVGILSASKDDELAFENKDGSPFMSALVYALSSSGTDLDGDGMVSLEEAYVSLYPRVVNEAFSKQHPTVTGRRIHRIILAKALAPQQTLLFASAVSDDLRQSEELKINGKNFKVNTSNIQPDQIVLLGDTNGLLGRGLTYISSIKHNYLFWREEQKLQIFKRPYQSSFAIIIAIDDYERKRDVLHRGPTGYEARGKMIQRAEELKSALTHVGFPTENIIPLYDQKATSEEIDKTLKTFWKGGERDKADRLLIYFGGHGDTFDGSGVLITYDFDRKRPTLSGFLMRDLATRHAENLAAQCVFVALDACSSGLALYNKLGDTPRLDPNTFQQLSIIRNDTSVKARNFLVAGTVDQPAIWDQGGIFTQALISGLNEKADLNNDRLIQFGELSTYVSNEVAKRAAEKGVRQQVQYYILDNLGTGKIVFTYE